MSLSKSSSPHLLSPDSETSESKQHQSVAKPTGPGRAFIGLGANLGNAQLTIEKAIDSLISLPQTLSWSVSSLYQSAPIDADGPNYVNAVMRIDTQLKPTALLGELQQVERDFGRERAYQNAPRTLDLDLILYDRLQMDTPALSLPHPRMHLRAFVLVPLAQLNPDLDIPGHGPIHTLVSTIVNQDCKPIPGSVMRCAGKNPS